MRGGFGVVAADPNVIPLHMRLYIENYGYAIAGDTGGGIRGYKIDLYLGSTEVYRAWGRREVQVWILD